MRELADAICSDKRENLKRAEIMMKAGRGYLGADAAKLYHYPVNHDKLIIGKFCSIACGAKFLFNSSNHILSSLSIDSFLIFLRDGVGKRNVAQSWDNKGDIIIGNDVWIGFEAVVFAGF